MSGDMSPAPVDPGDESIVHIAGPLIELTGRRAQRCSWCGVDLLEPPPGRPSTLSPLAFPDGSLVRLTTRPDGGNRRVLGRFDPADPPLDLCAYRVPDTIADADRPPPSHDGPATDLRDD